MSRTLSASHRFLAETSPPGCEQEHVSDIATRGLTALITSMCLLCLTCNLFQQRHDDAISSHHAALHQLSDQPHQLHTHQHWYDVITITRLYRLTPVNMCVLSCICEKSDDQLMRHQISIIGQSLHENFQLKKLFICVSVTVPVCVLVRVVTVHQYVSNCMVHAWWFGCTKQYGEYTVLSI